jgi:hypothetical protein
MGITPSKSPVKETYMSNVHTVALDGEDILILQRHYRNEATSVGNLRAKHDVDILKTYHKRMLHKAARFGTIADEVAEQSCSG